MWLFHCTLEGQLDQLCSITTKIKYWSSLSLFSKTRRWRKLHFTLRSPHSKVFQWCTSHVTSIQSWLHCTCCVYYYNLNLRKHTSVHPKISLWANSLDKAIRPAMQRGQIISWARLSLAISPARWKQTWLITLHALGDAARVNPPYAHAGVKAGSILLVLEAGLCQVNGEHTCHSNQASDTPID